ncbi:hypothetical protein ScPMuIL_012274 [Solemya velum]
MDALKESACKAIDEAASKLVKLSQEIWKNPELNFEEKHAHQVLCDFLDQNGLSAERSYKLDTAFRAVIGDKGPHVGILCEYDALPEIGHACGHNLIAEVGIAAGLGIKAAFDTAGKPIGKLSILGTPAEEGGGGKIDLIEAGIFDGMDAAMMAHPTPFDIAEMASLAVESVIVTFHGKASHAAAFPWDGVNALDAAVMCYQTISCMRQQFRPTWRVHGIIQNGGAKPNIIPEKSVMEYYIRTPTMLELASLKEKITSCFESAAKGTGCTVEYKFERPYLNVLQNKSLIGAYEENLKLIRGNLPSKPASEKEKSVAGSTDMGNVSYVIPSIHPCFYIGSEAMNHTRAFTEASGADKAQPFTLAQGKALALTALDIFNKKGLLDRAREDFEKDKAASTQV